MSDPAERRLERAALMVLFWAAAMLALATSAPDFCR
jgi:hypothetical protein